MGNARSVATQGRVMASVLVFGKEQKLWKLCEYGPSFWSLLFSKRMENNYDFEK